MNILRTACHININYHRPEKNNYVTYLLIATIQKQYEERDFEANFIWRIANPTRHKKPIAKHAGFNNNNIDNLSLALQGVSKVRSDFLFA